MTGSRWLAAALAALALAAAGCGGDDEDDAGTTAEQAPAQTQDETPEAGGETETESGGESAGAGRDLFAGTCGGCHTLSAAQTQGTTGPNLDELKPDVEQVRNAIREGPGIMPENLFEGAEADQVAQFVAENAGG
jgi:mono/diheme cytochrome c family protein